MGFTLVEVLLAGVLASLLLALFVMVLVPVARGTSRGADQVELRQMAVGALDRLAADLARTSRTGLSLRTGPSVVAIHPRTDVTADGVAVWDTQLVVYACDEGARRLTRRTVPSLSISQPIQLSPADLLSAATRPNPSQITVAAWVQSFSLDAQGSLVNLSLTVQRPGMGANGTETYQARFSQFLRM